MTLVRVRRVAAGADYSITGDAPSVESLGSYRDVRIVSVRAFLDGF